LNEWFNSEPISLDNINWLIETERGPEHNLVVRGKHYKQWISSYTTDHKTVLDHIYTNISYLHVVMTKIHLIQIQTVADISVSHS